MPIDKRQRKKSELDKNVLFINLPRELQEKVKSLISNKYDLDWVFAIMVAEDPYRNKLAFIQENGNISTIGCYYCLSEQHHRFDAKQHLWVAGSKAIPISDMIHQLPDGMQKIHVDQMNLWLCPHCGELIKRWQIEI